MRPCLFWLSLSLAPGLAGARSQETSAPAMTHWAGTIFELDVPADCRVVENGNGSAYTLDLVPATATSSGLRLFRLTAPETGRDVDVDEWVRKVSEGVLAMEEREGAELLERGEMSLRVFSAPQPGLRLRYRGEEGREYEDWLGSFRCCHHPVAVVARIEKDSDREAVGSILASLSGHEWGPETPIPRELDGIRCAFPALASVRRDDGAETQILQAELPDCRLRLEVRQLPDASGAREKLAEMQEWLDVELRSPAEMRDMEVDTFLRILWPLGAGTVVGGLVRMSSSEGAAVEGQKLLMRAGSKVLAVSASYPTRAREEGERNLQVVLDSLASDGIQVGREQEYMGDDLYLDLNERLPLEVSELPDGRRFEIHPTFSGGSPAPVFWIDVHEGATESASAKELLASNAAERLPGWELDAREQTLATLLGNSEFGWMASAHRGGERARIAQFVLPFGERWVAAGMVCDAEQGRAQSTLLLRILDRMRDLRHSDPLRYHDDDLALVIDPGTWTLQSLTREGERVVELTTGALRMGLRSHASEAPPVATPSAQESTPAEQALAQEIEEMGRVIDARSSAEIDPVVFVSLSPRLFGQTLGLVSSYVTTAAAGERTVHATLLVHRTKDWLEIEIEAPEDDWEDRELAGALLDTLEVPGGRPIESRTVKAPHLRLDVPSPFVARVEESGAGVLLIQAPHSDAPQLMVNAAPLGESPVSEFELMDRFLDTEREAAPPGTTEEEADAPLLFRGATPHFGERLLLSQPDGVLRIVDAYVFREAGLQVRVVIGGTLNGMLDGASSLRLLMRDLELSGG